MSLFSSIFPTQHLRRHVRVTILTLCLASSPSLSDLMIERVTLNAPSALQISAKAFSLETLDRKMVSFQLEIQESGLWLRCVPAPDGCQHWSWRIKDGKLELRE